MAHAALGALDQPCNCVGAGFCCVLNYNIKAMALDLGIFELNIFVLELFGSLTGDCLMK